MRREFLALSIVLLAATTIAAGRHWLGPGWPIGLAALFLLGVYDMLQRKHTLLRNFPVIGHLRFLLEMFRPEIQQYFIESDDNGAPISRLYRSLVYERAKGELETVPFGSELDLYSPGYMWANHSCFPVHLDQSDFRVVIGNHQCAQPYAASLFNISAMSYGSLSKTAIQALGRGAKAGGFSLNTGEGGLSPYHLESGCDIVWQLGTAYFGARDSKGYFDAASFAEQANRPQVKMIEIKISQGAKPGHGGILPGVKVNREVATIRRVPIGRTVVSPPGHTAFTNPRELCTFIAELRRLSGGKPIGIKFCLGRREEFVQMCEAFVAAQVVPDFITVDGGEGGTGAAPFDFINYVGSPLTPALYFVHHTLKKHGLREHVRMIASGKIMSGFNILEKLALGADLCNSARGMMLALGCIQAYRCNSNKCPTGIATNDPWLAAGLDITDKGARVAGYHRRTMMAMADLLGAIGLHAPHEVELKHISVRKDGRVVYLSELLHATAELSEHEVAEQTHHPAQGENQAPVPPTS